MKKRLKQVHYIALVLLFAVIAGMVLIENENFVGQALKGPLSSRPAVIPAVKTPVIAAPKPCPTGSIEITQEDVDNALFQGHGLNFYQGYIINQPGEYCLTENIIVDGSRKLFNSYRPGIPYGVLIIIASSDVNLNLNGYSIINTAGSQQLQGKEGQMWAIYARGDSNNPSGDVTVRNGLIRGFDGAFSTSAEGSLLPGINQVVVEDVVFEANGEAILLSLNEQEVLIQNNRISNGYRGIYIYERGITTFGEMMIRNNQIRVSDQGLMITATTPNKVRILNNEIRRDLQRKSINRVTYALILSGGRSTGIVDAEIEENILADFQTGINAINFVTAGARNNRGCGLDLPIDARYPARIGDINNNWNAQNC